MNKFISSFRSGLLAATVIVTGSLLFVACNKNDDNDNPDVQVAGLMAFNMSPDQSSVGFAIGGNNITNVPLAYTNYTGTYVQVYPGQRTVEAFNFNTGGSIASAAGNFEANKYYSAFLVGADSSFKTVILSDNVDTLSGSSGQAFIRYFNGIADSTTAPDVIVSANGSNIISGPANYATASEFVPVTPGDVSISVKNNSNIDASRTISVEAKKVYTILLVGKPGSGSAPVEIKFISNGTLDDSSSSRTSAAGRKSNTN
jgi:hypothetical protein